MSSATLPKVRKNGLQCPWHPYQILSYVIYLLFIVGGVFLLCLPIPSPTSRLVLIIYLMLVIAVGVSAMITTLVDPADDFQNTNFEKGHYCYVCRRRVNMSTEHCRPCNKCVSGFDHHCKWLNTCIGDKNYSPFLATLFALVLLCTASFVLIILMLGFSYEDPSKIQEWVSSVAFLHFSLLSYRISLFVFLALDAAVWYYALDLFIFHLKLRGEGNTTYQHFKKLDAQKKQKAESNQSPSNSVQIRINAADETPLSRMLEGSGNAIPAMTPSPVSPSPRTKPEGDKAASAVVLKTPPSGNISPLGEREDSFALRRGKESSFSSSWVESDHDYNVQRVLSTAEGTDGSMPKKEKSTVWDPSAFKGFAHASMHMESMDSQFGVVYKPKKSPDGGSVGSSMAGSRVTSPNENAVKGEVLSEVVAVDSYL